MVLFAAMTFTASAQCVADAAAIEITGSGDTETSICVDGNPDPIDVTLVGVGVGTNNGWVITDNTTGTILALPPGPPFNLDGAGPGVCDIWYLRYEPGLTGLTVGQNVSDLAGCFDLSNPIEVIREEADGGTVEIDITATGNPNNTTSISADGLTAVICVDGRPDPLVVTHVNTAPNLSYRYVITDNSPDSNILAIAGTNEINLDGAGPGTCQIWGWSYRGLADNGASFIGSPLADLQAVDCSDISDNAITVIREAADGGEVRVDLDATGNPNNTTSISADGESVVICVDGRPDPLVVVHDNTAPNLTYRYVITDLSETILAIADTNTIDLDGAGTGACRIWGWSYRGLDQNAFIGSPLSDLAAEDCSDISDNSILVVRQAADGGNVEIDIAATGNPNNTTSISADGMTAVICVDGRPDPIVVSHITSAAFLSYRYVITNEDGSEILAITDSDTISLDGAGVGTCQIWGWSYRGLADNGASFIGSPLADLQAVDCSDLSDESITVIREAADGGTVSLANGDTEVTICAGDGVADPLEVVHVNESPNLTYMYVITDSDADNTILAISPSSTIDLEGAGAGVCRIWGWSYRGLDGASFIGQPLDALQTEDCSDISSDFVEVTRQTGSDCILAVTDAISAADFSIYPNPASSIVNIAFQGNQSLNIAVAMYDITGRSVQQTTLNTQSSANINVSGLPSGIYILTMTDTESGSSANKRLIIR